MAVITPYARFRLSVSTVGATGTLQLEYARRSEEMPKPPSTIKHHPASVHAELLSALLRESKEKALKSFLSKDFSMIDSALASKMIAEMASATFRSLLVLSSSFLPPPPCLLLLTSCCSPLSSPQRLAPDMPIASLEHKQIVQLGERNRH